MPLFARLFNLQAREAPAVFAGLLMFFLLFCAYFMLRPVRETMGVAGGVDNLQWLFTGTFVATLAVRLMCWAANVAKGSDSEVNLSGPFVASAVSWGGSSGSSNAVALASVAGAAAVVAGTPSGTGAWLSGLESAGGGSSEPCSSPPALEAPLASSAPPFPPSSLMPLGDVMPL